MGEFCLSIPQPSAPWIPNVLGLGPFKDWGTDSKAWSDLFCLWFCCGCKRSSQRSLRLELGWAGLTTPALEVPPENKDGVWGSPPTPPHSPYDSAEAHFVPFDQASSQGRKSKLTLTLQSEYFHEQWDVDEQFLHCSLHNSGFCWNQAGVAQLPFFIYPDRELILFNVSIPPQGHVSHGYNWGFPQQFTWAKSYSGLRGLLLELHGQTTDRAKL